MNLNKLTAPPSTTPYTEVKPVSKPTQAAVAPAAPATPKAPVINTASEMNVNSTESGEFDPIQKGIFNRQLRSREEASSNQNSTSNQLANSINSILKALNQIVRSPPACLIVSRKN